MAFQRSVPDKTKMNTWSLACMMLMCVGSKYFKHEHRHGARGRWRQNDIYGGGGTAVVTLSDNQSHHWAKTNHTGFTNSVRGLKQHNIWRIAGCSDILNRPECNF